MRALRSPLLSALAGLTVLVTGAPIAAQMAQEVPAGIARQMEVTGKRVLDHDAYPIWRGLQSRSLSADGNWLTFRYVPGDGDAELIIRRTDRDEVHSIARGGAATLTPDGGYAVFEIVPAYDAVRQAERDETPRNRMPKDSLGILRLGDPVSSVVRIPEVTSFQVPDEAGAFLAYMLDSNGGDDEGDDEEETEEPAAESDEDEAERPERDEGHTLVLRALASGQEWRFDDVIDYAFTPGGTHLAFLRSTEDGAGDGAFVVATSNGTLRPLHQGMGRYSELTTADEGTNVAFMTDAPDWASETPEFTLMAADASSGAARAIATTGTPGMAVDWVVSEHGNLSFSRTGRRIFFGTSPAPLPEVNDTLLDSDRVEVDIWNWKDDYIMPMQLVQRNRELERTWTAVAHLDGGDRVVQLATPEMPDLQLGNYGESDFARGSSNLPYRQLVSWDGTYNDIYTVDVRTGQSRMIAEAVRGASGTMSPAGNYISWWDQEQNAWLTAAAATGTVTNLSARIPHPVYDVLDDHPQGLPPESGVLWTEGDAEAIVADQYDLWVVDPASGNARSLTEGAGRRDGLRFRWARVDPEMDAIPRNEPFHLAAFHMTTKASGIYTDQIQGTREPQRVVYGDVDWDTPLKAEDADRYVVSWSTFQDYPDYQVTTDFQNFTRMSDTNPQQSEYSWGSAEIYEWTSAEGEKLQGILYKPENFDPTHEYPMMVYFYERMSDGLHGHRTPSPGGSSIDFPFYVSRGYLLFVPDIPYKIGWPGESAMNAIVPGITSLIDDGFVDRENIGVQGHSWGGYQIAYMVTRTNIFAAAEAGAPVANMTSAYGGIRWGTGMSRAFQYERTQSRIGGTLWDAQNRYLENSPLFQADKIETPVLMMHNDEDTAVPWYQGIEMFSAMRRLQKPVWLLNYNGEAHGLGQRKNRKDWAMRMQQFFDHYLMDAPAPVWLEEGVPATLKGRITGLQLIAPRRPISDDGAGQ